MGIHRAGALTYFVLVLAAAFWYWRSTFTEDTDDAQVDGDIYQISSRVAGLRRMPAFHSIQSAASHHYTFAVQNKINFFRNFVVVREVRAPGGKIHPEKTGNHICVIDGIAVSCAWPAEQLVDNGGRMPLYGLLFYIVQIDNLGFDRRRSD